MAHTAHYHTFGCKLNFAETSTIAEALDALGVRRAGEGDIPDVVVVNTCAVTSMAQKKCQQAIRAFNRRWPSAMIAVTGCYAQLCPADVATLPGVGVVWGNDDKTRMVKEIIDRLENETTDTQGGYVIPAKDIRRFTPSCSRGDRTRYFLKVQDGCDYFCSYCTIPFARVRSRSVEIEDIVAQARKAAAEGGK
ncbi:MAG: tRNA (N(6)-L-threonylcarbamoyladenosine(37)-C(2))-methylthiotransferase MtaB, partial [Paramuribaculum sp.]|nr:tRNA (N(6)-L-threonylcarbamoyladenosine(37)-C(2))-methylthiotransferase MtaB [Paramuribaculum sp.]